MASDRLQTASNVLLGGGKLPALANAAHELHALLSELTGVEDASDAPDLVEPPRLNLFRDVSPGE